MEKFWDQVGPIAFISDGTTDGTIQVLSTKNFYAKQEVIAQSTTQEKVSLEVKRVINANTLEIGPRGQGINKREDMSMFLVADNSTLRAFKQSRNSIEQKEYSRAVYAEEPIVAIRTYPVDRLGLGYTTDNPFPVQLSDGSINIGSVVANLNVQLTHRDNDPTTGEVHDSVRIGDGTNEVKVNSDGSFNVNIQNNTGVDRIFKQTSVITDVTETELFNHTYTDSLNKVQKIVGIAKTFGIWRVYKDSISPSNLITASITNGIISVAEIVFARSDVFNNNDKLIVTFEAYRYVSTLLGATSDTFVRVEGFKE